MSNEETLQEYNERIEENNTSLANVLETINNLPEAGEVTDSHVELEYMGIVGKTYYELNTKLNNNCRVVAKFTRDLSSTTGLFGQAVYNTSDTKSFSIYMGASSYNNGRIHCEYGTGSNNDKYFSTSATEIVLDANKNNWVLTDFAGNSMNTLSFTSRTFTSDYNCTVGASIWGSGLLYYKGNLYYLQIYNGDTLVHDLIPVEKSDGTVTLYDKVNKEYLENLGENKPVAGPTIEPSNTMVKKIYEDGVYNASDDDVEGYSSVDVQVLNIVDKKYIIKDGIDQTDVTGGHTYAKIQTNLYPTLSEKQGDGYIALTCSQWGNAAWRPKNKLDLVGYQKLYIDFSFPNEPTDKSDETNATFNVVFEGIEEKNVFRGRSTIERKTVAIDVPKDVTNSQVFYFSIWNITSLSTSENYPVHIYNMWFEKQVSTLQDERVEIVENGEIKLELDEGYKAFGNVVINVNTGDSFIPRQNYTNLYNKGNQYMDLTGGYGISYNVEASSNWSDFTINDTNIFMHANSSDGYTASVLDVGTNNAIDLSKCAKVVYKLDINYTGVNLPNHSIGVVTEKGVSVTSGTTDVLAYKNIKPSTSGTHSGFYYVDLPSNAVGHPVVNVTNGQGYGTNTITIHNIFALKQDSWQTLYTMLGMNFEDYNEETLINDSETLLAILNNSRTRNYLINQCTGTLMFGYLNNANTRSIITSHEYYYEFVLNEHWKFFLEMFDINTDIEIPNIPNGDETNEWEAIFASAIDDSLGANVTKLPAGITSIRNSVFNNCTALVITEIPETVTTIGTQAFRKTAVVSLDIKGDITSIGDMAFYQCASLGRVVLRNVTSVPTIGRDTWAGTKFQAGAGYIYVPDALLDSFKTATYWSGWASIIKPISQLPQ